MRIESTLLALPAVAVIGLFAAACDESPTAVDGADPSGEALVPTAGQIVGPLTAASASMLNSNAPFQVWKQGFEHGTDGWVSNADPGPFGWCGTIERVDRRDLNVRGGDTPPSAGRSYAVVQHDVCNDFYAPFFPDGSAPAAADPALLSATFPASGFVNQVDIYLDPDRPAEDAFGYAVSFQVVDEPFPNFRYTIHDIVYTGSAVEVAGEEITEAGWYTFRHHFRDEGGRLAVVFEVLDGGRVIASEAVPVFLHFTATGVDVVPTGDFETSDLGSGYIWFVYITGFPLAIDEHQVRTGS